MEYFALILKLRKQDRVISLMVEHLLVQAQSSIPTTEKRNNKTKTYIILGLGL